MGNKGHDPLNEFFDKRLKDLPEVDPLEMGVSANPQDSTFRKPETFADIEKRSERVKKMLGKYKKE